MCKIYDTRPEFCKVEPAKYKKMFGIEDDELNDFCSFCCRFVVSSEFTELPVSFHFYRSLNVWSFVAVC